MAFTCRQCGECCSSMGGVIEILEELGAFSFRIRFSVTGEERIVSLDPDKEELFRSNDFRSLYPMACPFLRETGNKKSACSVHASRPDLCRRYSCCRVLVLDGKGNRIGRVADNSRYFTTSDSVLRALWDREIAGASIPDETCWEERVDTVLSRAGYRVVQ